MNKKILNTNILIFSTILSISFAWAGEYKFDANGRLIEKTSFSTREVYTYDDNGNMISSTTYSGTNTSPSSQLRYEYDADGHKISQTNYSGAGNIASNTPSSQTRYIYDGNNVIERYYSSTENISNNTPSQSYILLEYDSAGNVLSRTSYNNNGEATEKYGYGYDANGNNNSLTNYSCSNGVCNVSKTQEWTNTYDEHGNMTEGKKYGCGWGICVSSMKYSYEYDKYGNIVLRVDKSAPYATYTDTYAYDPAYINSQWLQHRKLIYTVEEAEAVSKQTGNKFRIRYK